MKRLVRFIKLNKNALSAILVVVLFVFLLGIVTTSKITDSSFKEVYETIERRIRDERHSLEYRNWRKEVIEKCGKVCCLCESTENLHVDHIKSFKDYPELRYDVENGRVLCFTCHKQTDNYGKKKQTVS